MCACNLLKKIEVSRKKMIMLSNLYGRTSEIVIQASKELDVLLNLYDKHRGLKQT